MFPDVRPAGIKHSWACLPSNITSVCVSLHFPIQANPCHNQPSTLPLVRPAILSWVEFTPYMGQKEHNRKILMLIVLMSGSYGHLFVSDALPYWYVCMVRCGRPAVFVWLCKLHTIGDHVLCHATVVSSTNIFKAEESRRLHVVIYWRVCSSYTQSAVCSR